jgi:hypothetical protein
VATHYDVLGVLASATPEEIRQAYRDKARRLHPDGFGDRPAAEIDGARRAMQDVNEAWRVLGDAPRRAAYDRSLRAVTTPPVAPSPIDGDDDELDRPYPHRAADPADLTVAIVRAVPWIAVLVVLGIIFVFTAVAKNDDEENLVGKCITIAGGQPLEVPCDEPNIGRVDLVVPQASLCARGSVARAVAGGEWYCLVPADSE